MTTARAFWITGKAKSEIRNVDVAGPAAGEVLVETLYTAISRGTESLVYAGKVPVSEYARMRAPFQAGEFPAPVKYGYINVGRVIDGHDALLGKNVFTLYPHQTRFVVPAAATTVIPDAIPLARTVLAANLETAVNALWDARPCVGDRVAVIGAGAVGCLSAWLARGIAGTEVELIDIDPERRATAEALGIPFRSPSAASGNADIVIHASGSNAGLATALDLAGFEATVLELSWYGSERIELALGERFHSQRLALRSSQVGHIATAQRSRWNHARRMGLVMQLLAADELDALITGESAFESLPDVMGGLASSPGPAICHRITYR